MKYKVGMYGGSFDPLHIGHIHDIIKRQRCAKNCTLCSAGVKEENPPRKSCGIGGF